MQFRGWKKPSIAICGCLFFIWICSYGWGNLQESKKHQEIVKSLAKLDAYGTIPLVSTVTDNRDIYDFDAYMDGSALIHTLFYHSADAVAELESYGKYLLSQGYIDVTPEEKDDVLVATYQKLNPNEKDHPIYITILWTEGGYKLQLSGF